MLPPPLRRGDRVIVVAPASAPRDVDRYRAGLRRLRQVYEVDVRFPPEKCTTPHGYLSDTDAERVAALNAALGDPSARAVMAARGGYGCTRILDRVDVAALARAPKWVIGYSDLTAIQWKLFAETGLVSASGPVVTELGLFDASFAHQDPPLDGETPLDHRLGTAPADTWSAFEPVVSMAPDGRSHREAETASSGPRDLLLADATTLRVVRGAEKPVAGPLFAGTLSVIVALAGTPHMPDLRGGILVLEDTGEAPYRVDRMLTQLRQGGYLDHLAGVVLGSFRTGDVRPPTLDMKTVLRDAFAAYDYPVVAGLRYGHILPRLTLPIGARAILDPRREQVALKIDAERSITA